MVRARVAGECGGRKANAVKSPGGRGFIGLRTVDLRGSHSSTSGCQKVNLSLKLLSFLQENLAQLQENLAQLLCGRGRITR